MELELRNLKGTKDFLPAEQQLRNWIKITLENIFTRYACRPLETPVLCHYEILASKYAGGEEILKEVYRLRDQGDRELGLRYDLTVPFARVIGMNPNLRLPFKRYEIGRVYRDGPVKTGRLREFMQCDVDIAGVRSTFAEAEIMLMALDAFEALGLDVYISYNNRKLLSGVLTCLGVGAAQLNRVILSLDKVEKIGAAGVAEELGNEGIAAAAVESIFIAFTAGAGKTAAYYAQHFDHPLVREGAAELNELDGYLAPLNLGDRLRFNPLLARGLEIYTGTVYEVFLTDGRIKGSIASGGRYDRIIGAFLENGMDYPAVGISFGLDVIFTALTMEEKQPEGWIADIFLIPLGTAATCLKIAHSLRREGIRVELEMGERRLKRSLDYANKEGIPFVLILGENELARGKIKLRRMADGEESDLPLHALTVTLKKLIAET
ncbi:MAG TPA: histidine--tRNA ligase [Firmicutes bacterium]|nr:histidine--tRNA ligase [Bacillota bacterium]